MTIRLFSLGLAVALLVAMPAAAQTDDSEGEICLAVAHIWSGTPDDIKAIEAIPVPESFRAPFTGGGCARFQLVEESLIDWHLAFGTEASVASALDFFTAAYGDPREARDFSALASTSWSDVLTRLQTLQKPLASPATRDKAERRLRRSREYRAFASLIGRVESLSLLATQTLRAAEFFGSPTLFEKAQAAYRPASAAFQSLARGEAETIFEQDGAHRLPIDWEDLQRVMSELDMRMALVKARLSRDPADVDAAGDIMARWSTPLILAIGDHAYEAGDDFCDIGEHSSSIDLQQACKDEPNIEHRVATYWRSLATLDLLMAADPAYYVELPRPSKANGAQYARLATNVIQARPPVPDLPLLRNMERAMLFLDPGLDRSSPFLGFRDLTDERINLWLMRAETSLRLADQARANDDGKSEADRHREEAMADLARAERLAPPFQRATRYRQIGELFLTLHDKMVSDQARDGGVARLIDPAHTRLAESFRFTLAELDRIRTAGAQK